jgi:hypothetical protein
MLWGTAAFSQSGTGQDLHSEVDPLSAIDWLSQSLSTPRNAPNTTDRDVVKSALPHDVETSALDQQTADAVGLLPSGTTGFPRAFWGNTPSAELARLILSIPVETLPALQDLTMSLLLAELDPPQDTSTNGLLFQSRIDKLLDIGALEQAAALLERANLRTPALFSRSFDIALLTENENAACDALNAAADLAPTITARVFCLARAGDWNAAALIFETGLALGFVSPEEDEVLARFLDPEFFDGAPALPLLARPNPLMFRLYAAVGEPIPTVLLPRAFAQTDLTANNGWRARLEAAERLVFSGAISDNVLLALYTDRKPAASGGVWDRVKSVQLFDAAMAAGDADLISERLQLVWNAMSQAQLEGFLVHHYATQLAKIDLSETAKPYALKMALLSADYEGAAQAALARGEVETPMDGFLLSLAQGRPMLGDVTDPRAIAIADGFSRAAPQTPDLEQQNLGKLILEAITQFATGANGDLQDVASAIATLRAVGLEDIARRAALELMLLERS